MYRNIHIYTCIYTCIYVCTYTYIYKHIQTINSNQQTSKVSITVIIWWCLCVYRYKYTCVRLQTYIYINMYIYIYINMYTWIYEYIYIHMYICMSVNPWLNFTAQLPLLFDDVFLLSFILERWCNICSLFATAFSTIWI
jgi:hypothetical protein